MDLSFFVHQGETYTMKELQLKEILYLCKYGNLTPEFVYMRSYRERTILSEHLKKLVEDENDAKRTALNNSRRKK